MKKFLYLIVFMLTMGGISAQAQTDSVKVRVKTSNGAEISLDGDLSSTNNIYKLVPVGKHVVEVKYGFDYTRTYEIDVVKGGQTEFEFMLEGKLVLKSTPAKSQVYVDGVLQGKAPVELPLLGRHNVKVVDAANLYHPYNQTLEVMPEQVLEKSVVLKKRPPKLYGFVMGNYMISAKAPGLMMGIGRRIGGYAKFNMSIGYLRNDGGEGTKDKLHFNNLPAKTYHKESLYLGGGAGLVVRAIPNLWFYAGSGYGSYCGASFLFHNYKYGLHAKFTENVKGALLDFGVMGRWKMLLLQAGYSRIMASSPAGHHFGTFDVGVGITIHKNKKDK